MGRIPSELEAPPRPTGRIRGTPVFQGLEPPPGFWRHFGSSFALHISALGVLLFLPAAIVQQPETKKKHSVVSLTAPAIEPYRPPQAPVTAVLPRPKLLIPAQRPPEIPVSVPPVARPPESPLVADTRPGMSLPESSLPPSPAPAAPRASVRTDVFSTGSSASATLKLPARQVQTGGFGDPNGIAAAPIPGRQGNIATLGSFDLPAGPGEGNGTAGLRGTRGTVAGAGFGNGVAVAGNSGGRSGGPAGGNSGRGGVQSAGFAESRAAPPAAPRTVRPAETEQSLEILSKPRPEYTDEARRLRLEGVVVLDVVFLASGEVRVLRVVRGLGHGLDETAAAAARQIRFRPARREGQPVDAPARIQVLFQLAY